MAAAICTRAVGQWRMCPPPGVVGGCNLHRRMAALCKQYCNAASLFPFLFLVITLGPGAYIRGYRGFS